jgi:hypothetical protein
METAMYYIYALLDNRTNLPFYIGKGKIENQRHLDHFKETVGTTDNRHKFYKIQYLKEQGYEVPISILRTDIIDEELAYTIEAQYIKQYGRENIDEGGILTNICIDNRPPSHKGKKQSSVHIEKRVNSYKKTINKHGKKQHTDATKKKIGLGVSGEKNGFYNKRHTEENKKNHSERMKGNKNNIKTYRFVSPDNVEYIVEGFYNFCSVNNLSVPTMEKIMRDKKIPTRGSCKGWFVEKVKPPTCGTATCSTAIPEGITE